MAQKDIMGVILPFYGSVDGFWSQANSIATPSFLSHCLENVVQSEDDDKSNYKIIKDTAGVFFLGASAFVLRFNFFFQEMPKLGQALQVLLYIR